MMIRVPVCLNRDHVKSVSVVVVLMMMSAVVLRPAVIQDVVVLVIVVIAEKNVRGVYARAKAASSVLSYLRSYRTYVMRNELRYYELGSF